METFTFSFRLPQSPDPAFAKPRKRRKPANEKRRARGKRRREAWSERRNQSSQLEGIAAAAATVVARASAVSGFS